VRYVFGFVLILAAVAALRVVGCGAEEGPECKTSEDCDDQNYCTHNWCFEGRCLSGPETNRVCDFDGVRGLAGEDGICSEEGVCVPQPCDDSNDCTQDTLQTDGRCTYSAPHDGAQPCDWNGSPGVCVDGVCLEYRCNDGVICDDGDPCTDDRCDHTDWACKFTPRCRDTPCQYASCAPADGSCHYRNKPDGTPCRDVSMWCPAGADVHCDNGECICHLGSDVGAFEVQP